MLTKFSTIIRKAFSGSECEEVEITETTKKEKPRSLYEIDLADFMMQFKWHLDIGGMEENESNKRSLELLEFMKHYKYVPFHDIT